MRRLHPLIIVAVVLLVGAVSDMTFHGIINVSTFSVDQVIQAGSAALGPNAPSWSENGAGNHCAGLEFDADAEEAYLIYEIPDCWDGGDQYLKVYWCTDGNAIGAGQTVKWDVTWRAMNWGTDGADNGTAATGTVTYTQPGGGDGATDTYEHSITMAYNDADQPLAAGDVVVFHFDRDMTGDTYANGAIVQLWEVRTNQTKLKCDHTQ